MRTEDLEYLESMVQSGNISVVPAGDSDDAYILNYARSHHGYIISNDMFLDHIRNINNESIQLSMKVYLDQFRCGYTFVHKEFYPNPTSALVMLLHNASLSTPIHPHVLTNYPMDSTLSALMHSTPLVVSSSNTVPAEPVSSILPNITSTDEKTMLATLLHHMKASINITQTLYTASLLPAAVTGNAITDDMSTKSAGGYNHIIMHLLLAQSMAWIKVIGLCIFIDFINNY